MASSGVTQSIGSLFGPPSEPIRVGEFVKQAIAAAASLNNYASASNQDVDMDIGAQCSVDDIRNELEQILDDPLLAAQLDKDHEQMVGGLYTSHSGKTRKAAKKAAAAASKEPEELDPEVVKLQGELDGVDLKSWMLSTESVMFVRPPRNADYNCLSSVKLREGGAAVASSSEAVLTVSIFNKVPWGPSYVARVCQHAFLGSQTLQDVFDALPCIYSASRGSSNPAGIKTGVTFCIENVLYCEDADTRRQMLGHLASAKRASSALGHATTDVATTECKLSSLVLRLHMPYQILHAGNCEHFMVVEQIRLWHPSDPVTGYPVALQLTPPLAPLCFACHKIPATVSVDGDVRLGESPSLLCEPCWSAMGESKEEEVIVTPLPV